MRYYRLTESRVKRIIRHPTRIEEGILDEAIACMQPGGGKKYSEIWTMYVIAAGGSKLSRHDLAAPVAAFANSRTKFSRFQREPSKLRPPLSRKLTAARLREGEPNSYLGEKKIKIITAWRYPGKSPERDPIPAEILREIKSIL